MAVVRRRRASISWRWLTDLLLFLSSTVILFVALALRFECPHWLRIACVALAILGGVGTSFILVVLRFRTPRVVVIENVEDRGADVGGYLATYLLPIAVVGTPNELDITAYALVLLAVAVVYVRSNLRYVNPTLYLLTYRLVEVRTTDGFEAYLITRRDVAPGDRLLTSERGRFLLDRGSDDEND